MPSQFVQRTLVADTLERLQQDPNFASVDFTHGAIGSGLRSNASQEVVRNDLSKERKSEK